MNGMNTMNGTGSVTRTVETIGNKTRETYTYKNADGTQSSISITKSKKKKKKRLNYNYKEVSNRIIRAKTSTSAGQVVILARNKTAVLRRKLYSGYNDEEIKTAIIHAEKMLRIARKKLKNLKAEELAERNGAAAEEQSELEEESYDGMEEGFLSEESAMSEEELRELMREMQQRMQEVLEDTSDMEELSEQLSGGGVMSEEDLERWKKKHRSDEMREIIDADMKYLKAMLERLVREQQNLVNDIASGVLLELGGEKMPVPAMISEAPALAEGEAVDVSV